MMLRYLLLFMMALLTGQTSAASGQVVITNIHYYQEQAASPLSLTQALQRFAQGDFSLFEPPTLTVGQLSLFEHPALTFGIRDRGVWVRLALENQTGAIQARRLTAGMTWLEQVDVFYISSGRTQTYTGGDGLAANEHLLPAVGIVFALDIADGQSEVWLRVQSLDPITLPIRLESLEQAQQTDSKAHLTSGLLYGILLALAAFQLVLYRILKHRNALFYTLYVGTFVVMNFGYTGYGFAWIYPQNPVIQNYSTLFFMVLHAIFGLLFMRSFLKVRKNFPRLDRGLKLYMLVGLLAITTCTLAQTHLLSALWAFGYITLTTLIMILTSLISITKVKDARYFLLAVCCSMAGLCVTSLSTLGLMPYSQLGYHSAEIGVVCEAFILAIIVTNRLKVIENERITTKFLATYDPLTKLFNRHAFEQMTTKLLQQAEHYHAPLSMAILDLDHFKAINDNYGHHVGDMALKHIADIMKHAARPNDIVARWGGEEIVVLMPNTRLTDAHTLCEELRETICNSPLVTADDESIVITASIGLASTKDYPTFSLLFRAADEQLYLAKKLGRNLVKFVLPSKRGSDLNEA
ncbi:putative diguanylate cyclase YedQ [Marinomonas aquimarina]|uniref:diguanylate cyclase n=1 Tax=Marinomonas aquimarina TaxID=295068 RepID=A0A1A8TC99_9GAMM|nr:diguanylate cyclase [Marinomonas aquimarina]SBS29259.1 putative diguanylate cyclase YedQ [Marinomonas aquimarina]